MMYLNNKNKTIDALIINKKGWVRQAKNVWLHVIFLFKKHDKNYIVRLLKKLITKGGKKPMKKILLHFYMSYLFILRAIQ